MIDKIILIIFDSELRTSGSFKLNPVLTNKTDISTINSDRRVVGEIEGKVIISNRSIDIRSDFSAIAIPIDMTLVIFSMTLGSTQTSGF